MSDAPENPEHSRFATLERRIQELELRVSSLSRAFSRARHQSRRIWLRPPIWTFEQYLPRKLSIHSSYSEEQPPVEPPSFAIVTPSYNQGPYLKATIGSVLDQCYPRLHYHVQDGGSIDQTAEILQSFGRQVSWRQEPDSGQAQAINRGFAKSNGEIMAYLNSDDMFLPGTLAYVARMFRASPDVDVVYGHRIFVDRDGYEIGRAVLPGHDAKSLCWADYVPQETLFWRRKVWESVGPLDETFHYALDWDFILRAQTAGFKFKRLPRFLACFRVHDLQKTSLTYDVGREEMQRLRLRHLGFMPTQRQVELAIAPYLARQLAVHSMYRAGLIRY
jgi:glycosyltransferase involved in cell wall biosynthesis